MCLLGCEREMHSNESMYNMSEIDMGDSRLHTHHEPVNFGKRDNVIVVKVQL